MKPHYKDHRLEIYCGDALKKPLPLPDESVQCCVTSPPYFGLRDYGVDGQLGREKTPELYVQNLRQVFSEIRRVLKKDGALWLNLGDSYAASRSYQVTDNKNKRVGPHNNIGRVTPPEGCKQKDLLGIPWMVAFALRSDGWWLRSEITWCKENPMPESVTDRPTSATEKIFLLTKSADYFYDADAVRNPPSEAMLKQVAEGYNGSSLKLFEDVGVQNASDVKKRIINGARKRIDKQRGHSRKHEGFNDRWDQLSKEEQMACGSNMRNFWMLGTEPCRDNHFATFPREIPRRCILASSRIGDVVLDPFGGSGTTGQVALDLGRNAVIIELNPNYIPLIENRTKQYGLNLA